MPRALLSIIALIVLLISLPASAQTAAPSVAPTTSAPANILTPEQARRALETLQDDTKRAQFLDTLRAVANAPAQPGPPQPAPPSAAAANPAPPAPANSSPAPAANPAAPPAAPEVIEPLAADSLGAQLLLSVSKQLGEISSNVATAARTITHFPLLWHWLERTATDPYTYNLLLDIAWKLALIAACALAVEWLVARAVRRPLGWLEQHAPRMNISARGTVSGESAPSSPSYRRAALTRAWQSVVRLPFIVAQLVLSLLPVVAFIAVGTLLLGTDLGRTETTRLVILALINAYVLCRGIMCAVRTIVSAGPLSLITVREETAVYIDIWAWRVAAIGAFGFALANVALLFGLYRPGYFALLRLVSLIDHLLVVVIILQCRRQIAQAIRSNNAEANGFFTMLRNRLAGLWHYLAIVVVLALWLVWALNIRNGFSLLLQYLAGTVAVVLICRVISIVLLGIIDRLFHINPDLRQRFPGLEARANRYLPMLRKIVSGIVTLIGAIALLEVWGVDALVWFYGGQIGSRLLSAVATIAIAVLAAVVVWEISNSLLDRQLIRLNREGNFARAARLRTFLPMLRTTLLAVIVAVVGLTTLSEIGVNVAPLLAGAGIIGIAIGFGSQKLVQDVITGLFLLLENVVHVGDTVTVSGLSGTVENVSIRTIRLRAGDGSVHIVPFSAVTSVTNSSRGIGNASVSVTIPYKEDTDRASEVLKALAAEMRAEPEFRHLIRNDLELWGVDKVDGSTATIVGQIPCTDTGRWRVQREFNRRMKVRFQECGIDIAPATSQTIVVQVPYQPIDEDQDQEPVKRLARG